MTKLFTTSAVIALLAGAAHADALVAGIGDANAASTSASAGLAASGAAGLGGSGGAALVRQNSGNLSTGFGAVAVAPVPNGVVVDTVTGSSSLNFSDSLVLTGGGAAGIAAGFGTGAGDAKAGGIGGVVVVDIQP